MATLIVNNKERRIEYTAAAAETNFTYDWSIFDDGDLDVYQKQILLVLNVDYTVTGAGVTDGGEVILTVGATLDDEIVIVGDLLIDQTIDFSIKRNFIGLTMQTQFNKLTMIAQELDTKLNQRGLLYNVFTDLKIDSQDNVLPQLAANQLWQMNAAGTGITAVEFEVDPGANTLRSELISNQSGSDGARIVGYFSANLGNTFVRDYLARTEAKTTGADGASVLGYFDSGDSTEKTIKTKLDELSANVAQNFKNIIIAGDFTTNPFQRGTSFTPIADGGFPADRFKYSKIGSMILKSSVETAGPPTVAQAAIFVNKYLRHEVTTGSSLGVGDFVFVAQNVEGFNWTRVAQRKFIVSFWVRSSITGTFGVSFRNSNKTISWVSNATILAANTWEKKTVAVTASPSAGTWDYENGVGIEVAFVLGAGTNFQTTSLDSWETANDIASTTQTNFAASASTTFDIALVQMEEGEVATSFEVRHFSTELAMCQRYFYKTYNAADVPGTITNSSILTKLVENSGLGVNSTVMKVKYPVRLRTQGSETIYSPVTGSSGVFANLTFASDVAAIVANGGEMITQIRASAGTFFTGEQFTAHFTNNAEL